MTRYEALITKDWQNAGIANVAVLRFPDSGMASIGLFLVDTFCLGVKDATLWDDMTEAELRDEVESRFPPGTMEQIGPADAKKLIEGALAYAQKLGFSPARDYRKARRVLGGIDTAPSPGEFTYGDQGRPHYIQGPSDSDERADRVRAILEARLGPGGYAFTTLDEIEDDEDDFDGDDDDMEENDDAEEDGDEPWQMMGEILELCINAPDPSELGGLITGMVAANPRKLSVSDLPRAFDEPAMFAPKKEAGKKLIDIALEAYWEEASRIVSEVADAADNDSPWPFAFRRDDFKRGEDGIMAMSDWARGFWRSREAFPEAWGGALARDELAGHWRVVEIWGDPERLDREYTAIQSAGDDQAADFLADLPGALATIIRAAVRKRD
jgi:hypothetical protein